MWRQKQDDDDKSRTAVDTEQCRIPSENILFVRKGSFKNTLFEAESPLMLRGFRGKMKILNTRIASV